MYKQYLEVHPSKTGKGVFTTVRIPSGVPIMEITGPVLLDREIPAGTNTDCYLQVGPNTFIGDSGTIDDYLNHSCDPNCNLHVVGNRAILYSLYVIPVDAELTFDYSTTSTDTTDTWKMDCKCGSNKCRKIVSGYQYLSDDLKKNYQSRNMVPLYITEPWLIQKR
jgi:hypothetical protein